MSTCQNCRRLIPEESWIVHNATCPRHWRICEDCDGPVRVIDWKKHASIHQMVTCDECGDSCEARLLMSHKSNDCAERLVVCQYCQCQVPISQIGTHESECGNRTEPCEGCHLRIRLCDFDDHICDDLVIEDDNTSSSSIATSLDTQPTPDFECPYCTAPISTYEDLQMHIFSEHAESI